MLIRRPKLDPFIATIDRWLSEGKTFGTERLTGALLDRLTHHVNILEMNGESYRLHQSRAASQIPENDLHMIGLTANAPWRRACHLWAANSKARAPNWPAFAPPQWPTFTPPLTGFLRSARDRLLELGAMTLTRGRCVMSVMLSGRYQRLSAASSSGRAATQLPSLVEISFFQNGARDFRKSIRNSAA